MAVRKASAKKAAMRKGAVRKAPTKRDSGTRMVGTPAEDYFARQTPEKRALLRELRALVIKAVPDAETSIKWGVPFYERNGQKVCALAAFKEHVAINFFAPPDALVDPDRKLEGAGKGNRTLKVRSAEEIDRVSIVRWLKATAARLG